MKKQTLIRTFTVGMVLGGLLLNSSVLVQAIENEGDEPTGADSVATVNQDKLNNTSNIATTKGQIILKENNEKSIPKDPTDPTKDSPDTDGDNNGDVPGGNTQTGNAGPLSLDTAPKTFDFGTQEMYMSEHKYSAEGAFEQYLQVTDNRDVDISGWQVTVKQDGYLRNEDYALDGATLTVPAGKARNSLSSTPKDPVSDLITSEVEVNDGEKTVFAATEEGSGKDTSLDTWMANQVSLTIPEKVAKAGNYTNELTWTLTAGATE